MDIVVKGRNVEVPEHYREHVADKLRKAERFDQKLIRADVELIHERNPRQSGHCQHVEITCHSRGPVIRAVAAAGDFYSALDAAAEKLSGQLRKAADRRRVHRGRRTPVSVGAATAELGAFVPPVAPAAVNGATATIAPEPEHEVADDQPWHIVREKEFSGEPMTVDDALYYMELVGHDFYLFHDKESGQPSVVYRRKAYDYGLLTLSAPPH